ncbi:hypothetical protein WN51_12815 [Melipona quadrifasciata]|uniref:Uncharacterized protein n=1 Tax=Melipona quadrifasciata TaxID=166423 RepID=A0A0M9A3D6_9HYME|nr:hypothetical protein WN51_12815 [Melipona quadrifasciata]
MRVLEAEIELEIPKFQQHEQTKLIQNQLHFLVSFMVMTRNVRKISSSSCDKIVSVFHNWQQRAQTLIDYTLVGVDPTEMGHILVRLTRTNSETIAIELQRRHAKKSTLAIISRRTSAEFLSLTPAGQQQLSNFEDRGPIYAEKWRESGLRKNERDEEEDYSVMEEARATVDVYLEMICIKFLPGDPGETSRGRMQQQRATSRVVGGSGIINFRIINLGIISLRVTLVRIVLINDSLALLNHSVVMILSEMLFYTNIRLGLGIWVMRLETQVQYILTAGLDTLKC